jgi:phosphoglycerate dehydrogenase-like enzyme
MKFVFVPPQSRNVEPWLSRLQDSISDVEFVAPKSEAEAIKEIADADAAFGTLSKEVLAAGKKLKWIQAPAAAPNAGYYYKELIEHPAQVTNFRGIYNDHISSHILAVLLSFAKHLNVYRDQQKAHEWKPLHEPEFHSIFLPETTALILGVGGIGAETARLCAAFGIKVVGIDGRREDKPEGVVELHRPDELDTLLPQADFVVLTIPHTPQTEGMFNRKKFQLMKKSAIFINIGRGMTTKLDDLAAALKAGEIAGAGLDVYEIEPLPKGHALWDAPNTILTPHIAAQGGAHLDERRYEIISDNVRRLLKGQPLVNVVDKANWF